MSSCIVVVRELESEPGDAVRVPVLLRWVARTGKSRARRLYETAERAWGPSHGPGTKTIVGFGGTSGTVGMIVD